MNFLKKIFKLKRINSSVDHGENIVASIAKCKFLYKRLIVAAHPDKHPLQSDIAEELTKAINRARYNYAELIKIEKRIESELK